MPEIGSVDEIARNLIAGWAIDTDNPGQSIEIVVTANGHVIERVTADKPRPNLIDRIKSYVKPELQDSVTPQCGFEISLDPSLSVFHEHQIEVRFAKGGNLLRRGERTLVRPAAGQLPLIPLLVTAAGRSGTTLMMQHLARHPRIVVAERYPYEIKMVVTPKHPPPVSPIGNNGFLFSRPRLKLIACGAGT